MRDRLLIYQEMYGDLYNLEATPAESTAYRLAKHDVARYPDIITAAKPGETPYYTNSSHLPVGYTDDIFEALDKQDELQTLYTSGTVFHAFLGERLPSWKAAADLVRKIAENYKLPYYTLSPTYSICKEHGYITGEHFSCPTCGEPTEVYSRITGYYRPVQNWNDGKVQEYKHRKVYVIDTSRLAIGAHAIKSERKAEEEPTKAEVSADDTLKSGLYLFTTKVCPNCKLAKNLLDRAGVHYTVIDAEENPELARKLGIMQAPTLADVGGATAKLYAGVPNIRKYVESAVWA